MKSIARIACAAMLGISLVACGGGGTEKPAEKPAATADASALEGTWKLAAIEYDGDLTVTGNFSQQFGVAEGNSITIKAGGTGTIDTGKESVDLAWEAIDDTSIAIADEYDPEDTTATLEDDELVLESSAAETMVYTKDGKYADTPTFDLEGIAIDDANDLIGTWDYCAIRNTDYGDFLAWGDADMLAKFGELPSGQLVFEDGGTGTMLGYDINWSLSESGVVIVVKDTNADVSVTKADDGKIICTSGVDGAIYIFEQA